MRTPVLIVLALCLSGCSNMVFSREPLFGKADARAAPAFKPGVWALSGEGCEVDVAQPIQAWSPECALGLIYTVKGPPPAEGVRQLIAAGDPLIVQGQMDERVSYGAIRITQTDDKGRIVAFESWAVLCGPPPPPRKNEKGEDVDGGLTQHLLAGLEPDGENCLAADPATVRQAAVASRDWAKDRRLQRWVRPARPSDRAEFNPADLMSLGGAFKAALDKPRR